MWSGSHKEPQNNMVHQWAWKASVGTAAGSLDSFNPQPDPQKLVWSVKRTLKYLLLIDQLTELPGNQSWLPAPFCRQPARMGKKAETDY